ncbi:NAD(P)/FAD-dependent oxidoreductase [Micromonospora sp. NPDC005806]|uniref:NAD(P)/FAD-dependent oxidoreductase n=1 Tax=Micromonospora sp. NPDC005806 TaxID=3364234 RepID=UPI00369E224B
MSTPQTYMIVGGGLAGARAAETLRQEGFDGRVLLVGAEPDRPYKRPPLSKGYLAGTSGREKIYVHDASWYAEHDVELLLDTRVTALDAAAHAVALDNGRRLGYDKLLLATGASARRLGLPGADLAGVHYLREVADADRLREALTGGGRRIVVVGGGWIGLETAAVARGYDNHVTVVEQGPTPLYAILGPEVGEVFASLHREHGVDLRVRTGVSELRGVAGQLTAVVTDRGEELPADIAIVGVGARPNTELAEGAGLTVDNGVLVDVALRSSHPDIHAAGDVANPFSPLLGRHLRTEHYANAKKAGQAAARSMLGRPVIYDPVPFFYTDQYDLGMEYAGYAGPGDYDRIIYRGGLDTREFVAFWLAGDRVVAGMNVNVWDVSNPIQDLIRSATPIDEQRLRDSDVPLEELVAVSGGVA